MTGMRDHAFGCTCVHHVDRPWRRAEHWTRADVELLETWYGRISDAKLAQKLGRSVTAIILKKRRLGIHKKDHGMTASDVAEIFGIDPTVVSKHWIRRGLLRARRGFRQGRNPVYVINEKAVEAFITLHPQYVDVDKMPDSPYRDLAAQFRHYSVAEVVRLTGRHPHALTKALLEGRYPAVKRGSHWYIPAAELPRIAARAHLGVASRQRILEVRRRREEKLELRRNRRKGVAA